MPQTPAAMLQGLLQASRRRIHQRCPAARPCGARSRPASCAIHGCDGCRCLPGAERMLHGLCSATSRAGRLGDGLHARGPPFQAAKQAPLPPRPAACAPSNTKETEEGAGATPRLQGPSAAARQHAKHPSPPALSLCRSNVTEQVCNCHSASCSAMRLFSCSPTSRASGQYESVKLSTYCTAKWQNSGLWHAQVSGTEAAALQQLVSTLCAPTSKKAMVLTLPMPEPRAIF